MKTRRRKTTTIKHRKKTTAVHRRASSVADLQRQLDQRTHELAEARKDLADALEQQMATSEILVSLSGSMTCSRSLAARLSICKPCSTHWLNQPCNCAR